MSPSFEPGNDGAGRSPASSRARARSPAADTRGCPPIGNDPLDFDLDAGGAEKDESYGKSGESHTNLSRGARPQQNDAEKG